MDLVKIYLNEEQQVRLQVDKSVDITTLLKLLSSALNSVVANLPEVGDEKDADTSN